MKTQLKRSLFCALLFILAMIKRSLAACDMYNLGEDCVPSCSRPGILLEDGKTCFCDPEKFLIDSERKKCVKKLGLGKYPSLKDDDADPNLHHMSAEKCNDKCRTCKIAEDFTSGDADHCTSCSMEGPFILDLTGAKPTCVAELPDNSAMVIIRKNRIIGVSNQTSEYGGSDENGELIDELQKDDEDDSYTSSNPGYGFGSCPDGNCSASGDGSMPPMNNSTMPPTNNSTMPPTDNSTMPPMDNSTMPPTDNSTTPPMGDSSDDDNMIYNTFFPPAGMLPTDNLTIMSGIQMWRADFADRRDMPTVISLLEKAGVEGIGFKQGREESCIGSIGEDRKPRGTQLDVIYVAVPCPDGCKECKVGEYGHLECTKPVDGKFVAEGKVLDACPDSHWFTLGEECIPCPAGPAGRCPACNINMTDPFNIIFECTQCPNNDPTVDLSVMGITFKVCNSTHQCENNEYFDGSSCASCGDNCAACMGDTCGFCSKDFAMKLNTDGTRECVPREDGCPRNHYVNDMNICTECDASCDGCWQRGSEYCFACSDTTKVLRPTQFLRVFKLNQEIEKDYIISDGY